MQTEAYNGYMEAITNNPVRPFNLSWRNTEEVIRKVYKEAQKRKDKMAIWFLRKHYPKLFGKGEENFMHKSRTQTMIQDALADEEEGVAFYRKILRLPGLSEEDKRVISNIIEDEERHYEALTDMLSELEKTRSREEWEEVTERKKREYKDVPRNKFADPEHHSYPVDSEKHVRAAWAYINMPKNARKYSKEKLAEVKRRIKRAAKRFGIEIADAESKEEKARCPGGKIRSGGQGRGLGTGGGQGPIGIPIGQKRRV